MKIQTTITALCLLVSFNASAVDYFTTPCKHKATDESAFKACEKMTVDKKRVKCHKKAKKTSDKNRGKLKKSFVKQKKEFTKSYGKAEKSAKAYQEALDLVKKLEIKINDEEDATALVALRASLEEAEKDRDEKYNKTKEGLRVPEAIVVSSKITDDIFEYLDKRFIEGQKPSSRPSNLPSDSCDGPWIDYDDRLN